MSRMLPSALRRVGQTRQHRRYFHFAVTVGSTESVALFERLSVGSNRRLRSADRAKKMSSFKGVLSVQASQTFVPSAVIVGNRERPVLLETFYYRVKRHTPVSGPAEENVIRISCHRLRPGNIDAVSAGSRPYGSIEWRAEKRTHSASQGKRCRSCQTGPVNVVSACRAAAKPCRGSAPAAASQPAEPR